MIHSFKPTLLASLLLVPAWAQLPPCFDASLGTNLQLGDDQVAQGRALGFAFPFAGRSVTSIDVSSNGFVWLGSSSDSACCNGDPAAFLSGIARIAAAWVDLNPGASGGVYMATSPGRAVVTWSGVPEYGYSDLLTIQLQLLSDGSFYLFWQSPLPIVGHTTLVGITPGSNAPNPRAIHFSTAMPYDSGTSGTIYETFAANTIDLGGRVIRFAPNGQGGYAVTQRTDCRFAGFSTRGTGCPAALPVTLQASASSRPVVGTNFDMIVGEGPNGSSAGAMLYGSSTSVPLTAIGMLACTQYSSGAVILPFVVQGRYSVVTLPIPNQAGLVGARFAAQAAIVAPGANPAGVVTSNGGDVEIGA